MVWFSLNILLFSGTVLCAGNEYSATNERLKYGQQMASYMDPSVDPCDDFHQYACGNYYKVHQYQEVRGRFGPVFRMVESLDAKFHELLVEPVNSTSADLSSTDKARILYQSCLDADLYPYKRSEVFLQVINSLGGWPVLKSDWRKEDFDWMTAISIAKSFGIEIFLSERKRHDTLRIDSTWFGLVPMYKSLLRPSSKEFQKNKQIAKRIMEIYGVPRTKAINTFNDIINFAKEWDELEETIRISLDYNKTDIDNEKKVLNIEELSEAIPELNWTQYFSMRYDMETISKFNISVHNKQFIRQWPKLVEGRNAKAAANYFMLKILFKLHEELLEPQKVMTFCIRAINKNLNPVVSVMYLNSSHHQKEIEDELLAMSAYIRNAFKEGVKSVDWLKRDVKRSAVKYIQDIQTIIGDAKYSLDKQELDEFYGKLNISAENSFHENFLNLLRFSATSGQFNDGDDLETYGVQLGAFYVPDENSLNLRAGIFQKPFFYPELPKSFNFGAIGVIIGHEFVHSMGGPLRMMDWFTKEADDEFTKHVKCFVEQYNKYPIENLYKTVEGGITVDENIADNGGVRFSFEAYQKWLTANKANIDMQKQTLPGLNATDSQLFFLSYGQLWCESVRGFEVHKLAKYDDHSPGKWRNIGPLVNFDEFSKAYNCPLGSRMNPAEKCRLYW